MNLCRCLKMLSGFALAVALTACASNAPKNKDSVTQISEAAATAYQQGDRNAAEQLYLRLSKLESGDAVVWTRLGNLRLLAGDLAQATGDYQRAITLDGNNMQAWRNLAVIFIRQAESALGQAAAIPSATPIEQQRISAMIASLHQAELQNSTAQQSEGHGQE